MFQAKGKPGQRQGDMNQCGQSRELEEIQYMASI